MQTLRDFAYALRFALRTLRTSPLVAATIVLCLGFSIGATGTVFAWMESIVFTPLPGLSHLDRLASLKVTALDDDNTPLSYPDYVELRGALGRGAERPFVDLAAFTIRRWNLRADAAAEARLAEPLWGMLATANYFDVLGVRPIAGRGFLPTDDAVVGGAPVVVISYALWQRRFQGDAGVIGRRIRINNREMTIVGVAPRRFHGTIARLAMDVWIPVTMHGALGGFAGIFEERDVRWLSVFGRLAPGVSLSSAGAAARTVGARLAAAYPEDKDLGLSARTLDIGPIERMAALSAVMLGITALVVLIVCSNVANLLLQRGAAREHEIAVRLALGANPARIVRQLMTENLLLAAGGVVFGALVLVWARNPVGVLLPDSPLPIVYDTPIEARVMLVLAGVGVSTVFMFGLAPALRSARVAVRASLSAGGSTRSGSRAAGRARAVLVSAQFAMSLVVLVTAGLFLRRLDELKRVDRGFQHPQQVVLNTVDFAMSGVEGDAAKRAIAERLVSELGRLPGVRAAAAATFVPLGFVGYASMETAVDGHVPRAGESMWFLVNRVSANYFEMMGIPIVRGRPIDAADRAGAREAAVVNEAFTRRFWGDGDPVGRAIRVNRRELTVVGVAANGKYDFLAQLDEPSPPFIYLPFAQWSADAIVLHVRADGDPLALVPTIARTVTAVDGRLNAISPATLDSYSSVPYMPVWMGSVVLSVLGGAALVLASVGLYAVIAYAVAQQRREIGIRIALGATRAHVVRRVLGQAARYTGAGAAAGLVLAVAIAEGMARQLPGSIPNVAGDRVSSFALALGVLGGVAALAAAIPANRAARVNPSTALRDE